MRSSNPKDISLRVHLDKETAKKLDDCVQKLGVSNPTVVIASESR